MHMYMYVHVREDDCLRMPIDPACTECSSSNANKEDPQPAAGKLECMLLNCYTYILMYN